jgi:hypothetical protein
MAIPAVYFTETNALNYGELFAQWGDTLAGAEITHLRSLRLERDRRDYVAAHVLQRLIAQSGMGRSSLTHCDGFVACAFSMDDEAPIGVDAEPATAQARLKSITEVLLAAEDSPAISHVALWTVKEAYLKQTGEGFTGVSGFAVLHQLECTLVERVDDWDMIALRDARTGSRVGAWTRRVGGHVVSVVGGETNSAPRLERVVLL